MFIPNELLQDFAAVNISAAKSNATKALTDLSGGLFPKERLTELESFVSNNKINETTELLSSFVDYSENTLKTFISDANLLNVDIKGNPITTTLDKLKDKIPSQNSLIAGLVESLGFGEDGGIGLLNSVIEKAGGNATPATVINSFTKKPLNLDSQKIFNEQMISGDTDGAAATALPFMPSGTTQGATKAILEKITVSAAGTIVVDSSSLVLGEKFKVTSDFVKDKKFTYVSSREELETELRRGRERDISEVVVHWTESYVNANLSAEDIEEINTTFGFDNIVYHYIIKRDGSLQRGLDISEVGEHCSLLGHNENSIGLVFVGGLNMATNSSCDEDISSAAALTRSQINTFNEFMQVFYNNFPGGQALGHRDIDLTQDDPGFDVIDYCETVFGKSSLYTDPSTEPALTPTQIVNNQLQTNTNSDYDLINKGK